MEEKKNEIILFENQGVKLEVNLKDETVWLTQEQMSKLFGKAKSTINEHIKNVYKEGELIEKETMTKFGNSEFSPFNKKGNTKYYQTAEENQKTMKMMEFRLNNIGYTI